MRIFTSFFDNWRVFKPLNIVMVSVAKRRPRGFSDIPVLLSLVPNEVCEKAPQGKFAETYWKEVLMKSDPTALYNMLKTISQANDNADIVLCDFSAPSEHNYRRQIAAWLQYYLHVVVDEFPVIAETKGVKLQ